MTLPGEFFEAINGVLAVMFVWVMVWFIYDILVVFRVSYRMSEFYREAAASIACLTAFSGDLLIRGSVWWFRHIDNDGIATAYDKNMVILLVAIGVLVAIIGCACVIRHLSPYHFGQWPWFIAVTSALIFGIVMAL